MQSRLLARFSVQRIQAPTPFWLVLVVMALALACVLALALAARTEPDDARVLSAAEEAAFEAGKAVARDELAGHVVAAYEQGRRDALVQEAAR
jgi:cytochrome oxidase Cu insertion factor (SCO1/SenC/PrrC family)